MVCLYCGSETQVINSRLQKRQNQTWRRRRCLNCQAVFSTHESASYEDSWRVKAPDGSLKPFLRNKLFLSLHKSCEHRPKSVEDATSLTHTVISLLRPQTANGLLEPANIILTAQEVLKNFDASAAVHYEAFHQASY